MKTWMIIALYWMVCCACVYANRWRSRKNPLYAAKNKGTKLSDHFLIALLCPIAAPIMAVAFAYKACYKRYYRNRPRPLPKKLKRVMRHDIVLDEDNKTISIAKYNHEHGTEYTLDDVYGKGYTESLTEEEQAPIAPEALKYGLLDIQKDLPQTLHTEVAMLLGNALLDGYFEDFENMLATDVEQINYNRETFYGKDKVADYWKGWRTRYVITLKANKYAVVRSNYYSKACLLLEMMVVLFFIKDNKVKKILFIQRHLNPTIGFHDDMLDSTFALDSIRGCLSELPKPNEFTEPIVKENRIPCLSCGRASEKLEWHSCLFQAGYLGHKGVVSVCPHCHQVVEYYPEMRIRFTEPVPDEDVKRPIY